MNQSLSDEAEIYNGEYTWRPANCLSQVIDVAPGGTQAEKRSIAPCLLLPR